MPLSYILNPRILVEKWKVWWQESAQARVGESQECPYGKVGDRLWVRETFGYNPDFPGMLGHCCYRADPGHEHDGITWKPSIHMPRGASRITLEITGVSVERLQDVNGNDAIAEGLVDLGIDGARWHWERYAKQGYFAPWRAFKALWESINDEGSWDANPWVWAISFKRIDLL